MSFSECWDYLHIVGIHAEDWPTNMIQTLLYAYWIMSLSILFERGITSMVGGGQLTWIHGCLGVKFVDTLIGCSKGRTIIKISIRPNLFKGIWKVCPILFKFGLLICRDVLGGEYGTHFDWITARAGQFSKYLPVLFWATNVKEDFVQFWSNIVHIQTN